MATIFHRARLRINSQILVTASEHQRNGERCSYAAVRTIGTPAHARHATRLYGTDATLSPQAVPRERRGAYFGGSAAREQSNSRQYAEPSITPERPKTEQDVVINYDPLRITRSEHFEHAYAAKLQEALLRRDGELIMRCVASANEARDTTCIGSISDADFTDMLSLIQPQCLFGEQIELRTDNTSKVSDRLGLAPVLHMVEEYARLLGSVVRLRRSSQAVISLQQYALILKACAYLHHRKLARVVWEALRQDGHEPDLACFNGYLAAIIWEAPIDPAQKKCERVLNHTLAQRKAEQVSQWLGWFRSGHGGVFQTAQSVMEDMVWHDISPDVDTWCNFIRAASLEGRTDAVSFSLQKVWGINVAQISAGSDPDVTPMAKDDPLYPTTQLLFDVVRAYCINNDIFTAFKLVDSISRHFTIEISKQTWEYLLEWAYIQSRQPRSFQHEQLALKIDSNIVMSLWQTMSAPPFNVKQTSAMANSLMRCAFVTNTTFHMLPTMEEFRDNFTSQIMKRQSAAWADLNYLRAAPGTTPAQLSQAVSEWESASLRQIADRTFLCTWLWYLFQSCESYSRVDLTGELTTVTVPRLLISWFNYAPRVVTYCIPTGMVELELRDLEDTREIKESIKSRIELEESVLKDVRDGANLVWQSAPVQSLIARLLEGERAPFAEYGVEEDPELT